MRNCFAVDAWLLLTVACLQLRAVQLQCIAQAMGATIYTAYHSCMVSAA
jgi:hypothetical protein